jgi:hypothetical protein
MALIDSMCILLANNFLHLLNLQFVGVRGALGKGNIEQASEVEKYSKQV